MEKRNLFQKGIDWIRNKEPKPVQAVQEKFDPVAFYNMMLVDYTAQHFDGEKNLGEIGPAKNYILNYDILRIRSWQSYVESEVSQIVIKKFITWIIGGGLKLQSNPAVNVLKSEGINLDAEAFNDIIEPRFSLLAKSKNASNNKRFNLNRLARTAYTNAIVGGDVVVVLRVVNRKITVQLIDGCHLQSPNYGTDYNPQKLENGNVIKNGIEMDANGVHVAYHIRTAGTVKYERIPCKVAGMTMAYIVYGLEYRIDNSRGMPFLTVILETLKKLERYKEATVGSAEERQKIPYFITHGNESTGTNPFIQAMVKASNPDGKSEQIPSDTYGQVLADKAAATFNKMVLNMERGSKLESLEARNELYFEPFYMVNFDLICASLNMPPEVALSKYGNNFSASRAALKDWEHTINVNRDDFSEQFYQPIYDLKLHIDILSGKVKAPGYIQAFQDENEDILEAYRMSRWVGPKVPHIDPLKEVNAVRAKLGPLAANLPLTTIEAATEELNAGDSDDNLIQFADELAAAKKLGVIKPEKPAKPEKPPVPVQP